MGQVHPPVIIVRLASHHMMRPLKWALERRGRSVFLTLAFSCIQDVTPITGQLERRIEEVET